MSTYPSHPPPPYTRRFSDNVYPSQPYNTTPRHIWYKPQTWSIRNKIIAGAAATAVVIVIIAAAVLSHRVDHRYPAYAKLTYTPRDTFQGTNFFAAFDYFTGYDPSLGFVHYVDAAGSQSAPLNLTYATANSAVIRVDTSEVSAPTGRKSARITSKQTYDSGLFVFDIRHAPVGCGTWPAVWLSGPTATWPQGGEIDVYETVNQGTGGNQATLHTTAGCDMNVKRIETGSILSTDCLNSTNNNAGCGVQGSPDSAGPNFNANGGGIYATELRTDGIRSWFFPRTAVPSDITSGAPDPSRWGIPQADFPSTDCSIGDHFHNMSIVVNIDLCGSWAGDPTVYGTQSGCPGLCTDLVAGNATAFADAYFEFGSVKVYQAQ